MVSGVSKIPTKVSSIYTQASVIFAEALPWLPSDYNDSTKGSILIYDGIGSSGLQLMQKDRAKEIRNTNRLRIKKAAPERTAKGKRFYELFLLVHNKSSGNH